MQITFDSAVDGMDGARRLYAMLGAYLEADKPCPGQSGEWARPTNFGRGPTSAAVAGDPEKFTLEEVARAFGVSPFLPGDQSAAPAPSDAVAAQSPTAPEAPPVSVPPPPIDAVPPAPAPIAPSAPAAPSSPVPSVDSTGLPWDERIHAANRGTNADGRWRKKKGLNDAAFIGRVEAELRTRGAAPVLPAPPAPPTIEQAAASAAAAVSTPPVPPVPPAPAPVAQAPDVPPAPSEEDVTTPSGFLGWVATRMTTGKLSFPAVADAVKQVGLNVLSDVAQPQNAAKLSELHAILAPKVTK